MEEDDIYLFPETTTGKKTLNDTAGITYQAITEEKLIDQEPDDDENFSSEEKTCFKREVIKTIHETPHKEKTRPAYQSSYLDILQYNQKTENKDLRCFYCCCCCLFICFVFFSQFLFPKQIYTKIQSSTTTEINKYKKIIADK